ncbi:hypothetical protein Q4489_02585 [Thalassotalea sp. 1_MG-2023]|uniref:hypothetical protein n=1 Tax=Thalassotalea sp. 1_MG-2023 TaxID=3062680 RepID=UPI0026E1BCDB|nr:hypothetical protein [Thalassotalea sp. 1_MG-2023]MDO6425877.1 hypothetical protein [Thalassotalea sp. 1_MG-2023]
MINNINNYSTFFSGNTSNSASSEVDDIIASHKSTQEAAINSTESSQSHLFLSSKAQKISAIKSEFFSGDGVSFNDIETLKTRAYQLGLINKEEYGRLSNTEFSAEEIQASDDISTKGIANYITDFLQRLEESDAGVSKESSDQEDGVESEALIALKSALTNARTIINDVENEKTSPEFKEMLMSTITTLKDTINASAFEKMPVDDNVGLTKVYQTLEIVDRISPQRLTNEKLNQYMSVSLG